jgi:hypothetical protein
MILDLAIIFLNGIYKLVFCSLWSRGRVFKRYLD